jgi:hypothetical protein
LRAVKRTLNSAEYMSADGNASLDDLECEPLVRTAKAQVAIARRLLPAYRGINDQKRGRFEAIMNRWCEEVPLTPEMFNGNEGRSSDGILIQAFKGFKIRLYGFVRQVRSVKSFLIVELDPAKKQDKADPKVLKRAKNRADEIGKGK